MNNSNWLKIHRGESNFKKSLIVGLALATFSVGTYISTVGVSADDTATSLTSANSSTSSSAESNSSSATTTSAVTASSASVATATAATSSAEGQTSAAATTQRVAQPNVEQESSDNQGALDSAGISGDSLEITGWHATNNADGRNNHILIVFDQTQGKEIARTSAQTETRTDVAKVYPNLSNALKSGFTADFDLTDAMVGDSLQIISRYSASSDGNSDYVDYWYAPFILNKSAGSLDEVTVNDNNSLTVRGWNAADESFGKDYHYLIAFDTTTNKQLGVISTDGTVRKDVANVYGDVYNSVNSGFKETFDITGWNINDNISIVSSYSNSSKGNGDGGNYIDYWFNLPGGYSTENAGSLDEANFKGSDTLYVRGWNATNEAIGKPYHYEILLDSTTGKQIGVIESTTKRPDVVNVYRDIKTANESGFEGDFTLTGSVAGHQLTVVSRYSDVESGNGDQGDYVDYWYPSFTLTNSGYSIDHFSVNKKTQTVHVDGWMASDYAIGKDNAYIIALNTQTGLEVARQKLTLTKRTDVAKVYNDVYNSLYSGFSADIPVTAGMSGENLQFVLRFSSSDDGNKNNADIFTDTYQMPNANQGSFDDVTVNGTSTIDVRGWHAADGSYLKDYEYLIVVDMSGKELTRVKVENSHQTRQDVYNAYPNLYNSLNSQFSATINVTNSMKNKYVRIIDRFTDSANGDGDYVDLYSKPIAVGVVYNINANSINSYIVNNHLSHASIQTQIWSGYPTDDMNYENGYAKPEGVVVHETATYNDNIQKEMDYAMNNYENAFVHSYVSDSQIINVANTDYMCWGSGPEGNARFVQFETIEVHSQYAFAAELNNAAYYTAYLLNEYGLQPELCVNGVGTVWSHHNVTTYLGGTDHTDPDGYWAMNASQFFGTSYTMSDFFELVKYYYSNL